MVSTHAPARGATRNSCPGSQARCGFNPRPPHGGRPSGKVRYLGDTRNGFNPRPPHGGRPCTVSVSVVMLSLRFQPTPPHGGRLGTLVRIREHGDVSIHAPARGATRAGWRGPAGLTVSTHAPARGATGLKRYHGDAQNGFNPRPRTGGDSAALRYTLRIGKFQPTPPHGGRLRGAAIAGDRDRLQWGHAVAGVEEVLGDCAGGRVVMLQWGHAVAGVE